MVPNPARVKTRSMGNRGRYTSKCGGQVCKLASMAIFNSSIPSPVLAETFTNFASCKVVPAVSFRTSFSIKVNHSGSVTRSVFVRTRIPVAIPNKSIIARCSRVWGITPSSAETTIKTASIPPIPASMFSIKSRCPGTSTIPTSSPPGSFNQAKPRSMVICLFCSSLRRSGLIPVRA